MGQIIPVSRLLYSVFPLYIQFVPSTHIWPSEEANLYGRNKVLHAIPPLLEDQFAFVGIQKYEIYFLCWRLTSLWIFNYLFLRFFAKDKTYSVFAILSLWREMQNNLTLRGFGLIYDFRAKILSDYSNFLSEETISELK